MTFRRRLRVSPFPPPRNTNTPPKRINTNPQLPQEHSRLLTILPLTILVKEKHSTTVSAVWLLARHQNLQSITTRTRRGGERQCGRGGVESHRNERESLPLPCVCAAPVPRRRRERQAAARRTEDERYQAARQVSLKTSMVYTHTAIAARH